MENIKNRFLLIGLASVIVAFTFAVFQGYSFKLVLLGTVLLNGCLMGAIEYGKHVSKPLVWQVIIIIFIGVSINILLEWGIPELFGSSNFIKPYKPLAFLPIISCVIVSAIEYKSLSKQIHQRIDACFPPLWGIVSGCLIVLLVDGNKDAYIKSMSILIVVVALIITACFKSKRRYHSGIHYEISKGGYLKYIGGFVGLMLVVSYMLPMMNQLPFHHLVVTQVEKWLKWQQDSHEEINLTRYPSVSDRIICEVKSDAPVYLRRLAYETYNEGSWKVSQETSRGWTSIGGGISEQIYPQFREMLTSLAEGEVVVEDLAQPIKEILDKPSGPIKEKKIIIKEEQVPKNYLSVNGLYNIEEIHDARSLIGYKGTLEDIYFTNSNNAQKANYAVYYNDYVLEEGSREKDVLEHMTVEEYSRLVSQVFFYSKEKSEGLEVLEEQIESYKKVKTRYIQMPNDISEEIKEYGEFITLGCYGDLEKAEKIEEELKYSGNYIYQIGAGYKDASNDPVLDFLLYGKAGTCQDFASGMVLLCRSIGLPARYVDGYLAREKNEEGGYVVRQKDAHAFVEVYISGYGWMLFDPTTSYRSFSGKSQEMPYASFISILDKRGSNSVKGIGLGIIFITIFIGGSKRIRIYLWGLLISRKSSDKIIQLLLKKILKVLEGKGYPMMQEETLSQYTERLQEKGIDIRVMTECFERYYYGKKKPLMRELREIYRLYIELNTKGSILNKKRQYEKSIIVKETDEMSIE